MLNGLRSRIRDYLTPTPKPLLRQDITAEDRAIAEEKLIEELYKLPLVEVKITLHRDSTINAKCATFDATDSSAKLLAYVLYMLNSGRLEQKFVDVVAGYAKDLQHRDFAQNTLVEWDKYVSEPIISPSEIMRMKQ